MTRKSKSKIDHNFKVLLTERPLKQKLKKSLQESLEDYGNDKLLSREIMTFISGRCNKCKNKVCWLTRHRRYKDICYVCFKKYKP